MGLHGNRHGGCGTARSSVCLAAVSAMLLSGCHGSRDPGVSVGSRGLRFTKGDAFYVEELWSTRKFQCFYGSLAVLGDHVYGSSGSSTAPLMAAINARTGELAWRTRGFALSNVVGVGNRLVVFDEDGKLTLATPAPDGLTIQAEAQVLRGTSLTPPTVQGKIIFVRDLTS